MKKWRTLNRIKVFPLNALWLVIWPARLIIIFPISAITFFCMTDWEDIDARAFFQEHGLKELKKLVNPFYFLK